MVRNEEYEIKLDRKARLVRITLTAPNWWNAELNQTYGDTTGRNGGL